MSNLSQRVLNKSYMLKSVVANNIKCVQSFCSSSIVRQSGQPEVSLGPLSHVRVLDLSRVLAGPYCTMILGDLGAEIVKIEHPVGGDDTRDWGPPFLESGESKESCYFLSINRNKKSVCVNLKEEKGWKVFHRRKFFNNGLYCELITRLLQVLDNIKMIISYIDRWNLKKLQLYFKCHILFCKWQVDNEIKTRQKRCYFLDLFFF